MFWGKMREISRIVREIPVKSIVVPENRIRHAADDSALENLADSIREHGIIEPLIVRKRKENVSRETAFDQWELIAGERRLRAAELAGKTVVPCVSVEADDPDSTVLAIIENLHREDLSIFEEAAAIHSLIELTGMTQEQCAKRLCVSQSYVANKMRLLRLTAEEQSMILQNKLSERHSRALLRFDSPDERLEVLGHIINRHMNVAQAEEYVESMLCAKSRCDEMQAKELKSEQRRKLLGRDIRQFCFSIDNAVEVIRKSGIPVESTRKQTENGTLISILLPDAG